MGASARGGTDFVEVYAAAMLIGVEIDLGTAHRADSVGPDQACGSRHSDRRSDRFGVASCTESGR